MPTDTATYFASIREDTSRPAPIERLSAGEAKARRDVLADVEAQCASHGRHPAEWDTSKSVWISPDEPAVPYAVITATLAPPRRCREVICELLAAGIPVACTAHQNISDAADQKRVIKAAKKMVTVLREGAAAFAPHVLAAVGLGIIQPGQRDFCVAVQERIKKGEDAEVAVDVVVRHIHLLRDRSSQPVAVQERAMADIAGSVTVHMLEQWMNSMSDQDYADQLKAARLLKDVDTPEEATLEQPTAAIGSAAEKTAQFIASFYHQEVKQAKLRRSQGKPPQPLIAASAKRKAPDDNRLPQLPPGCRWGYCTPDRFFVPFDPITGTMGDFVKVGLQDGTHASTTAAGGSDSGDVELKQLAHMYHPVLWAPEKAMLADRAWGLYSEEHPGVERTDTTAREAAAAKNTIALKELRVEHFKQVDVRQLVRDVALAVQERISQGNFAPNGSVAKAREALKVKALALQLPQRDASLGDPTERLLGLEYTPPAKSGPSAKKHKA